MKKVFIVYQNFLDKQGNQLTIGGIQTYIHQLIDVIKNRNEIPVVVQFADCEFQKKYKEIEVFGVDVSKIKNGWLRRKKLIRFVESQYSQGDLVIFATDHLFIESSIKNVIGIQHGIGWDIPKSDRVSETFFFLDYLRKSMYAYRSLRRIKNLENMVCVDYNYLNWYRTQLSKVNKKMVVIPNASKVKALPLPMKEQDELKIIFARRFVPHRGTRLFAEGIKTLLDTYQHVSVTFAGEGPDEPFLKSYFQTSEAINFIRYQSEACLEIHEKYDISVIPTLGSEGTSLSLLEAMASGCAVVTTNVGGLTNIVLDQYNGLIVNPDVKSLTAAIERLIVDSNLRNELAANGYQTVLRGFNQTGWEKKWNAVLDEVSAN